MNRQDPNTLVTRSAIRSPRRRRSRCRFAGCRQREDLPAPRHASPSVVMPASVDHLPDWARQHLTGGCWSAGADPCSAMVTGTMSVATRGTPPARGTSAPRHDRRGPRPRPPTKTKIRNRGGDHQGDPRAQPTNPVNDQGQYRRDDQAHSSSLDSTAVSSPFLLAKRELLWFSGGRAW
jgi:hypothetical protein